LIKKITDAAAVEILGIAHEAEGLIEILKDEESGLFIDVGGNVTQFFGVERGQLKTVGEFEAGGMSFSHTLADDLGIDEDSARIMKEKYADKKLTVSSSQKIKAILSQPKLSWLANLKKNLKSEEIPYANIILFGGGSYLPEIEESFQAGEKKANISFLSTDGFRAIEDLTKKIKNYQKTPALIILKYAQKIL